MKFNRKEINYDFLKEARDHLLRKDCIVVGGNDNDDVGTGFNDEDVIHSPLMDLRDSGPFIARKDEFGSWLLFNYKTGAKLRFSFDPNIVVTKSSSPELVDIKITNKCSKGCSFCYQGSCVEGKHASLDDVTMISDILRDSQIPEVAIGGGEPTEHPDFAQILHRFGYNKIVPNFTTATLNWVKDKFILKSVKENVGAFAFSVQNEKQIDELEKVIDKYDFSIDVFGDNPNVTAQVVLGTIDMDTFKAIVEKCRKKYIHLTVLGFKETERGKTFEKKPYENWIKIVKESDIYRMGVDTCIIAEFGEQLKEISSCFEYTSTPEEGAFSTYIDAVELKMGKSSYSNNYVSLLDDDKELRYSSLINKFAKQYKKFQSDI
jgi:molybdenum cofactor biosynthesis enzyme MoaA